MHHRILKFQKVSALSLAARKVIMAWCYCYDMIQFTLMLLDLPVTNFRDPSLDMHMLKI